MKFHLLVILLLVAFGCSTQAEVDVTKPMSGINKQSIITKSRWDHGSADCDNNQDPAIDTYQHDEYSFIIRQNKCLTYEAPFIYVLVGKQKVLVFDTGDLGESSNFSLYTELEDILSKELLSKKEILVVHSHGHRDHYRGDSDFDGRSNVRLVKTSAAYLRDFFGFTDWPKEQKTIELGDRQITVIPTPGHQEEAISIYDQQTKWLMTGDTLYPGYIFVKNWREYQNSIDRLAKFASNNKVTAILGAHIEMKNQAKLYYPIGSTYQPNEAQLDLSVESLQNLNTELKESRKPREIILDDFIVKPMNGFQRTLSNASRWFTQ
jgi:glyoxylase-like metal-dependent hydrolase (beta-lactamase superfamily II)